MNKSDCELRIDLPYPPTINHYWRRTARGMALSDAGRAYRYQVLGILLACGWRDDEAMVGPVKALIEVYPPDAKKRDLDNIVKGIFDALQHGGVFKDDSQVYCFEVVRRGLEKGGRVSVTLISE